MFILTIFIYIMWVWGLQRHKAYLIDCRSTNSVWVRQCGATKGRLCPNHTETEFYGEQSTSTKVYNDILNHDLSHNGNTLSSFMKFLYVKLALIVITASLYSSCFSLRGLITCGQCLCCLSRTSPFTSVSPSLWVNLASKEHEWLSHAVDLIPLCVLLCT